MNSPQAVTSRFSNLIPGEVQNDPFGQALWNLAQRPEVTTILEIGSSSGTGSTRVLATALKEKASPAQLYCLEVSTARFAKLREEYRGLDFVHCYNLSSVPTSEFIQPEALVSRIQSGQAGADVYAPEIVLTWLNQEVEYICKHALDNQGIVAIKSQHSVEHFGLAVLDGGDFSSEADLRQVYGAKYIALRGIDALRNAENHRKLKTDPRYELLAEDALAGYSVFARKEQAIESSGLDVIIPGEIKGDRFYETLRTLCQLPEVRTVLEIGSSAGGGSTEAFVSGMRERSTPADLYCMEVSVARLNQLRETYRAYPFVHCFNVSSVALKDFVSREAVANFYDTTPTSLRAYPKEMVLGWLETDLEYVRSHGMDANGIQFIKQECQIDAFDLVLIDGSEFTGEAELRDVYGAKIIALDDINALKNWHNHLRLAADPNYKLVIEDRAVRNGFSVFRRVDAPGTASPLDVIIPGEVRNDAFYDALQKLARRADVTTILEIGSSAGGGSTEAFVSALRDRTNPAQLFCMEVSAARFAQLQATYREYPFVHCYNVSSVPLEGFATHQMVDEFCENVQSALRGYPKQTVLGWLDADLEYVKSHGLNANGIEHIKQDRGIAQFDLVLIDGSEFTGETELRHVYGAKYIALDDINAYKNWYNYFRLKEDPAYELVDEDRSVRNGFAVFQRVDGAKALPVHFFTIVLNGMPFIRYHIDMMLKLPFPWHWHVVEGVADLKHDTAWSVRNGGAVTDELHLLGRSRDGTTEYLNSLAGQYPDKISIYRKPVGEHWDGKLEMVNAPLKNIRQECLLWEIDADELWTAGQIAAGRELFLRDGSRTSAFYWCHFFVGRDLAVSTRNCYSQNPGMEWLRTWRYYPNCHWVAHEPPRLAALQPNGQWADQGVIKPLMHAETEQAGLVFHHYAYTTPSQLRFKEIYYGYRGAVTGWNRLQANPQFPCALKSYLPWVHDKTQADKIERLGVSVLPEVERLFTEKSTAENPESDIIVDAVFFQYYNTGIARVWRSLLAEWAGTDFGKRLLILDRLGKAPRIAGLRYLDFPAHDYANLGLDQQRIQQVCDSRGAQLFISTYYTTPVTMPSVLLVHDMIPEILGADMSHPMWAEKLRAINEASAYVCVSQNTANDLIKYHPDLPKEKIVVAHNGVGFQQPSASQVAAFKSAYQIEKPYFLISGGRSTYKNTIQFFKAFAELGEERSSYSIVCTGPREPLSPEFMSLVGGASVHLVDLTDEELTCAYAGAIALVYPSLYEGFGMPIIEAMACGCPVITCPCGPLPEVGGDAALYVAPHDIEATVKALRQVQDQEARAAFIAKGLERSRLFSWKAMADRMAGVMNGFLQPA